ncbi:DUF1667 domain-containing protein [Clostridium sp. Mt-5]|uniref:DUF1667 domain-containing protein n=1 Tax=Clostridium moutaii TaxID=3240932 RepID=A0ABV4BMY2_9CLOT
MKKDFTCIVCPNGCDITIEYDGKQITSINGATCKRGEKYVKQEIQDPKRTIATLVKVKNGKEPLVSVRTKEPIPKNKIFDVVNEIKKIKLEAPVEIHQIVRKNILELGSDVIATKSVEKL